MDISSVFVQIVFVKCSLLYWVTFPFYGMRVNKLKILIYYFIFLYFRDVSPEVPITYTLYYFVNDKLSWNNTKRKREFFS